MGQTQVYSPAEARKSANSAYGTENRNDSAERIATGLGWFSVGLGLAEVVAPGPMADLIGVRNNAKTRTLLRSYGVRELAAGIGILTQTRPAGWLWSRVAGDVLDLASLGSALSSSRTNKTRVVAAAAAVLGVTALDILSGQHLSTGENGSANGLGAASTSATKVVRSIIVDRPVEEVYGFWRDFENFPRFMTYVQSVRVNGERRTHWITKGPAGKSIEWDAETLVDEPNSAISWRSVNATAFTNSGTVRFQNAPGNRGTLVRVEMAYAPVGGILPSALTKLLGPDLGQRISHDLRNFKQMLELGEVTQSDASIHSGMHPAQAPMVQPA